MSAQKRKHALRQLFWGICLCCIFPAAGWALVAVIQTQIASGYIVHINADHSVKLDNGNVYYLMQDGQPVEGSVDGAVSLKYYVKDGNKNIILESAPGLNSLQINTPNTTGNK